MTSREELLKLAGLSEDFPLHRGYGEHIKEDHKGHSQYFAVWRYKEMKRSERLGFSLTRDASHMRSLCIKYLERQEEEILITIYADHDNGFRDPYEFIAKTKGIFRCFYNVLNKKQDKGDFAALQIGQFFNPERNQK